VNKGKISSIKEMNKYQIFILKIIRKIYIILFNRKLLLKVKCIQDPEFASQLIYDALVADNPFMISRFGANELNALINYQGVVNKNRSINKYVRGEQSAWWWNDRIIKLLHEGAGFFPPTIDKIEQFSELLLHDISEVDILGSWIVSEKIFERELEKSIKIHIRLLEPFWSKTPWTVALKEKKVLIVHPFVEDIEKQYKNKEKLFSKNILPDFHLTTIKAVLSLAEEKTQFKDWFEALEFMKFEIDKVDYDICLIGCGAYGFHLAAHVKRSGKKSVHLGGALQLLFGIKGKRWEDPNYGVKEWGIPVGSYSNLMNEYWVRPDEKYKPKNAELVEGACYW
jgi:hypothetical protein